ncbi:MAG: polysaccharide pyruvyl transferase family protein [Thermoleophilaceae bacterium]|nr:polysaccharide pyruvyl transferase family protein [Thermoleophilaceae bacterium]
MQTSDGMDLNLGDEAISECLERGVRRSLGADSVVLRTINVDRSGQPPPPGRVSTSLRSLHSTMRRSKVAVLGGGTLIQDDKGLALYCFKIAALSLLTRTPLLISAIGVERVPRHLRPLFWSAIKRSRSVTVRDAGSLELFASWTRRAATVSADPLFLPDARDGLVPGSTTTSELAVSLRPDASDQLVGNLAKAAGLLRFDSLLAVPTDRRPEADERKLRQLFDSAGSSWSQVSRDYSWGEAVNAIANAKVLVGMRLHACIFAAVAGTPAVVVRTENKTIALADELGIRSVPTSASVDQLVEAIQSAAPPDPAVLEALSARAQIAVDQIVNEIADSRWSANLR